MAKTKIEWTEYSWNPVVGCTKCSPGCLNCYAERMAKRQVAMGCARGDSRPGGAGVATWVAYSDAINPNNGKWSGDIALRNDHLDKPLHWRKPRRIFVCSMSDLFHPKVPFDFITKVLRIIEQCPQHTFLILTKRPEVAFDFYGGTSGMGLSAPPLPNVHFGVSISNQKEADEKIPILLQIPAAVRWLSIEPMLEKIVIPQEYLGKKVNCYFGEAREKELTAEKFISGQYPNDFLDGAIVGGESGPGARPMHPDWARNIRDQCVAANVPFFFKQWGKYFPDEQFEAGRKVRPGLIMLPWSVLDGQIEEIGGRTYYRVGKKKAGCLLDGKEWNQLPER